MKDQTFWKNKNYKANKAAVGIFETDYLVVGGGIAGTMCAYLISKNKLGKTMLIEQNTIGSGATGHSAGTIVTELEEINSEMLIKKFSLENATEYMKAHDEAFSIIKKIIIEEKIQCDMREGDTYMVAENRKESQEVAADLLYRQQISSGTKLVTKKEILADINCDRYVLGQRVHEAMCVNPLKLVQGISQKSKKYGLKIYENTKLLSYKNGVAITQKAKINYKHIILALDSYGSKNSVHRFLTTIGITKKLSRKMLKHLKLEDSDVLIEQKLRDFYYMRPTKDNRLLIGFGDKAIKNIPNKFPLIRTHAKMIETYLQKTFPVVKTSLEYAWTSMYCISKRGILTVKHNGSVSEIYGGGLQTTAVVGSMYILSKIKGEKNSLDNLFK